MEGSLRGHAGHARHTEVVPRSKDIAPSSTMRVARRRGMMPSACSIQVVARIVKCEGNAMEWRKARWWGRTTKTGGWTQDAIYPPVSALASAVLSMLLLLIAVV